MSHTTESNYEFEIVTTKSDDGYTIKLMRTDRTLPSASVFVDTETLSDMASTFGGSQDKALDFVAEMLVSKFAGDRKPI